MPARADFMTARKNGEIGAGSPGRSVPPRWTKSPIYTGDHPVCSRLAGGFRGGRGVVDAKIFTTTDGMALDVFWVQDAEGQPFTPARSGIKKETLLIRTLKGEILPCAQIDARRVKSRDQAFCRRPAGHSTTPPRRSHRGRDQRPRPPGFLNDVTRALNAAQISIHPR